WRSRMFGYLIVLQLACANATAAIFRAHAANSMSAELFAVLCPHLCDRPEPLATLPSRIAHELLVSLFFAGESHFFGIDDYHEIPGSEVGGKNRFVLAAQNVSDQDRETTQHRAVSIDHVPFELLHIVFGQVRTHQFPHESSG